MKWNLLRCVLPNSKKVCVEQRKPYPDKPAEVNGEDFPGMTSQSCFVENIWVYRVKPILSAMNSIVLKDLDITTAVITIFFLWETEPYYPKFLFTHNSLATLQLWGCVF